MAFICAQGDMLPIICSSSVLDSHLQPVGVVFIQKFLNDKYNIY